MVFAVPIFSEGFEIYCKDFAKFCGLLRIYELYGISRWVISQNILIQLWENTTVFRYNAQIVIQILNGVESLSMQKTNL